MEKKKTIKKYFNIDAKTFRIKDNKCADAWRAKFKDILNSNIKEWKNKAVLSLLQSQPNYWKKVLI